MPKTVLASAVSLASGGVVTRAALVAGGVHARFGDRMVRAGAWCRLAPSIYLTGAGPPTDAQLVQAARHHAGEDVIVTGLVACRALELIDVPAEHVVEVLVEPGTRSVSGAYIVIHQSRRPPQTWTSGGLRYAMPERAVVDAARRLGDLRAVRALVLSAVCQGAVGADDLRGELDAGPRRGSGLARRAIDDAIAGAWSAPEAETAELVCAAVRDGRLPPFLLNATLLAGGCRIGQPDGYLVGAGVGWQVDSRRHHSSDEDFDTTLAVHDTYAAYGLTMLHVTPRRLRRLGAAWVDVLVDAVQARRAAGHGEPPGLLIRPEGPLQSGYRRRALPPAPGSG
ncbi:MAG: hypothetical protein ACR2K2_11515 [Mycobacteriales bacterium]